jgi:hypothetical protein
MRPHPHRAKWKHGYLWVTFALFLISLGGHWLFGWFVHVNDAHEHGQPVEALPYAWKTLREMMENWQSEFLQLIWQVAGLALLWSVGSPSSKEGDERREAKLDYILENMEGGPAIRRSLDKKFPKE